MSFLIKVETWISKSIPSDDGWSQIKPFIFLKLTTDGGYYGWGEAFTSVSYTHLTLPTI